MLPPLVRAYSRGQPPSTGGSAAAAAVGGFEVLVGTGLAGVWLVGSLAVWVAGGLAVLAGSGGRVAVCAGPARTGAQASINKLTAATIAARRTGKVLFVIDVSRASTMLSDRPRDRREVLQSAHINRGTRRCRAGFNSNWPEVLR